MWNLGSIDIYRGLNLEFFCVMRFMIIVTIEKICGNFTLGISKLWWKLQNVGHTTFDSFIIIIIIIIIITLIVFASCSLGLDWVYRVTPALS